MTCVVCTSTRNGCVPGRVQVVAVIDFTADWCPPSREAEPLFKRLQATLGAPGPLGTQDCVFAKVVLEGWGSFTRIRTAVGGVDSIPRFVVLTEGGLVPQEFGLEGAWPVPGVVRSPCTWSLTRTGTVARPQS